MITLWEERGGARCCATASMRVEPHGEEVVMTGDAAEIGGYDPVRSFEPPRAGFDLGTASSDALSRRGLPRRPDPEREPYLAERWASVFGRPLSIVGAELASDPLMLRGRKDALTSYGVDGWAGLGRAIVRRGISDPGIGGGPVPAGAYLVPATFVSAEWEVPRVMGTQPIWMTTCRSGSGWTGSPKRTMISSKSRCQANPARGRGGPGRRE